MRFNDAANHEYEFTSRSSSHPPSYAFGEQVKILYDPKDPKESARLDTFMEVWLATITIGILTIGCAGFGIFLLKTNKKSAVIDRAVENSNSSS